MVFIVITGVFVVLFSGIVLAVKASSGAIQTRGSDSSTATRTCSVAPTPTIVASPTPLNGTRSGSRWSDWRWRPSPSSSPQPGSGSPANHAPNALRRWRASTRRGITGVSAHDPSRSAGLARCETFRRLTERWGPRRSPLSMYPVGIHREGVRMARKETGGSSRHRRPVGANGHGDDGETLLRTRPGDGPT